MWLKFNSTKKRSQPIENDKKNIFGGKSTLNNSNEHFNAIQ